MARIGHWSDQVARGLLDVELELFGVLAYFEEDLFLVGGFKYVFDFHPYLGKWSNLTDIFQTGKPPTRFIFGTNDLLKCVKVCVCVCVCVQTVFFGRRCFSTKYANSQYQWVQVTAAMISVVNLSHKEVPWWDDLDLDYDLGLHQPLFLYKPPSKLTWQWKITLLKMNFPLEMVIFHCHVSLLVCNYSPLWESPLIHPDNGLGQGIAMFLVVQLTSYTD